MQKQYYVYILFSQKNGTLYVGVTSDLVRRVWEHKNKVVEGFTKKYNVDKLGYYEVFEEIEYAIIREKRLKKFLRKEKLDLIEKQNPKWIDLYDEITGSPSNLEDDKRTGSPLMRG
ncbi:MAG: GIY-YIG nuclease family protein [Alphaproteobacteria bacterium]|nr:GIY-YIG nuclease family protein [Alphaproteobacteria bacterium]